MQGTNSGDLLESEGGKLISNLHACRADRYFSCCLALMLTNQTCGFSSIVVEPWCAPNSSYPHPLVNSTWYDDKTLVPLSREVSSKIILKSALSYMAK